MFDELIKELQNKMQETINTQKDLAEAKENLEKEYKEKSEQILRTEGILNGRLSAFNFVEEFCKNAKGSLDQDCEKESDK